MSAIILKTNLTFLDLDCRFHTVHHIYSYSTSSCSVSLSLSTIADVNIMTLAGAQLHFPNLPWTWTQHLWKFGCLQSIHSVLIISTKISIFWSRFPNRHVNLKLGFSFKDLCIIITCECSGSVANSEPARFPKFRKKNPSKLPFVVRGAWHLFKA